MTDDNGRAVPEGSFDDQDEASEDRRRFALLAQVVDLPVADREAILAASDPSVAADVRAMLADDDTEDGFLESPALIDRAAVTPEMPEAIGPYRLLEQLGEGGMGRVFLAEQDKPVRRRVALKILRTAVAGREARARFEAERHAMERLDHPNVGKILDAGTTDNLPYFAMELIDGTPVTTFCDDRSLSIEDRLRLFVDVCRGVDHAHRKLLLHRDLKPSNVLVTEIDGRAVPKVIDLGIAKGLDRNLADATLATGNQIIGTPAYMSPEALGQGGDIDLRSDVFSLGVVLYELLTGLRPWAEAGDTPLAALRRSADDDVARPSTRVTTVEPDTRRTIAARRGQRPVNLSKQLRGDLDRIALKAIAFDPSERYGSAAELAADLERFLANEPVSARPPTVGYLLCRMMRRHRGRVIAAFVVACALVLGTVGTSIGYVRARAEADRANREADAARRAEKSATGLASFMTELFKAAHPDRPDASTVTARELRVASAFLLLAAESLPHENATQRMDAGRHLWGDVSAWLHARSS